MRSFASRKRRRSGSASIDRRTVGAALHHAVLNVRHFTQFMHEEQTTQDQQQTDEQADQRSALRVRVLIVIGLRAHGVHSRQARISGK